MLNYVPYHPTNEIQDITLQWWTATTNRRARRIPTGLTARHLQFLLRSTRSMMQSTHIQGARAKTSTSRICSTANEDQPQHVTITIDSTDCTIVKANWQNDSALTQTQNSKKNTNQGTPVASLAIGTNPHTKIRSYAGNITKVRIFPDHQAHQLTPQQSEAQRHDLLEGTKMTPWTPQKTYDVKGCANFHHNSEVVVLTSLSGHPHCAYCRITSHPRSTCPMKTKHLAQNIDWLYHPGKGIVKSNNERRWCNKFPYEDQITNHNIAGTSKIRAQTIYTGAVSLTKTFCPPNNTDKFINETDKFGVPNYWSIDGQLIVSHVGLVLCNYCGVPSHSREKCKLKIQDEAEGRSYNAHPNRGRILSNNQSIKQLQPTKGASYKMFKNILTMIRIGPNYSRHTANKSQIRTKKTLAGTTTTTHLFRVINT